MIQFERPVSNITNTQDKNQVHLGSATVPSFIIDILVSRRSLQAWTAQLNDPPMVTEDGIDTSEWPQNNLIVAISSDRGLCGGEERSSACIIDSIIDIIIDIDCRCSLFFRCNEAPSFNGSAEKRKNSVPYRILYIGSSTTRVEVKYLLPYPAMLLLLHERLELCFNELP